MENATLELKGYGYGYGYGSGYGSGDGYGDGSGDGYGDGYGYGYGYGDGYGDGDVTEYIAALLSEHERPDAVIAVWRSTKDGHPANGGDSLAVTIGLVQEVKGPLALCSSRALHGTLMPHKWKGERWWIVALHHPVQIQDDKIGSLKRTIIADLGKCPFD